MGDFLKLYRSLRDHWLWREKPFSPGQAWVDLLMRANWRESKIPHPHKMGPTTLGPGELICSKRSLSCAWGWDRKRVQRFFNALTNDSMIAPANDSTYTRVKILNWSKLQGVGVSGGTTTGATVGATNGATLGTTLGATPAPHPRSKEGKEGKEKTIPGNPQPSEPSMTESPEQRALALGKALALVKTVEPESVRTALHEFLGWLESRPEIPGKRVHETIFKLSNMRQSIVADNGIPYDRLYVYALRETMKYDSYSASYVGKVIQNAIVKWREGALRV